MDHPSYEEIVLLHSGELDTPGLPEVQAHLASCGICSEKLSRLDETYGIVAGSVRKRARATSVAKKSLAAALTVLLIVYLLTDGTASARADELLSRASTEELKTLPQRHAVRVRSGAWECHLVSAAESTYVAHGQDCTALSLVIRQAGWEAQELLSPQKFQAWRHGIAKRVDAIEKAEGFTRVTTKTTAGTLRLASMAIRTSDYRAISAHYEFAGEGAAPLRLVEVAEVENLALLPEPLESSVVDLVVPTILPTPTSADAGEPVHATDRAEARVRSILHEAGASGNVLLALDRAGSQIRVWGVAGDDNAKGLLTERLSKVDNVMVELVSEREQQESEKPTPWNPTHGDAMPLALKQIDALFPNQPEARQTYLNGLDRLARDIAGSARDREAVQALAGRMADSPESVRLAEIGAALDRRVLDGLESLRRELSPLMGQVATDPGEVLTGAEGAVLYELVQQVAILSIRRDPLTLDTALSRLALLLHKK